MTISDSVTCQYNLDPLTFSSEQKTWLATSWDDFPRIMSKNDGPFWSCGRYGWYSYISTFRFRFFHSSFLSERHTIQIQQYVVRYETGCKYREELIVTGPWSVAAPSHSEWLQILYVLLPIPIVAKDSGVLCSSNECMEAVRDEWLQRRFTHWRNLSIALSLG